jgi:hypothetical protein
MGKRTTYQGQPMPNHTAVYMAALGYDVGDCIVSEISGRPVADINHLDPRGMGGSEEKDFIENLMGLTRDEHNLFEENPELAPLFVEAHRLFLETRLPLYQTDRNNILIKLIIK